MHWMSVKLPDNCQMGKHSWPCRFHIKYGGNNEIPYRFLDLINVIILYLALCILYRCLLHWNSKSVNLFTDNFLYRSFMVMSLFNKNEQSRMIWIFSSFDIWCILLLIIVLTSLSIAYIVSCLVVSSSWRLSKKCSKSSSSSPHNRHVA